MRAISGAFDRMLVPAAADLHGQGNLDRRAHGADGLGALSGLPHQGGTRPCLRNLGHGAAHVQVDDVRALVRQNAGGLGQVLGLGAQDLHGDGLLLGQVGGDLHRALAVVDQGLGADLLARGQRAAELLADQAERGVGNARHGSETDGTSRWMGADVHELI